jgi:hypothetical protein
MIKFKKLNENEISWKTQNEIHALLNKTYKNSQSFINKTYALIAPSFRVLAYNENNELVGHHAAFEPLNTVINVEKVVLAGVGLYASLAQTSIRDVAVSVYKETLRHLADVGYEYAIAISSHPVVLKISESHMGGKIIDIPVKGCGGYSKRTDKLIVVNTKESPALCLAAELFVCGLKDKAELVIKENLF